MMDREIRFNPDSFKLVQSNTRIMDKKLETKPTTFAKDAFRRFCKNKSSIVAAIILAILILLTIFVPVLSPYNITDVNVTERMLAPKLFESGTGFWDGWATITSCRLCPTPSTVPNWPLRRAACLPLTTCLPTICPTPRTA